MTLIYYLVARGDLGVETDIARVQVDDRGGYSTPKGYHDDRVFALGIAYLARKDLFAAGAVETKRERPKPRTVEERHWDEFFRLYGDDEDHDSGQQEEEPE